jgi:hypothetical protein
VRDKITSIWSRETVDAQALKDGYEITVRKIGQFSVRFTGAESGEKFQIVRALAGVQTLVLQEDGLGLLDVEDPYQEGKAYLFFSPL